MGRILFWLSRPAIWIIVRISPPRTRIVVVRGDKILLVKDWLGSGRWKLPGGGLHRKEESRRGAVRELHEEVRCCVLEKDLVPLGKYKLFSSGVYVRLVAFWVEVAPNTRARINRFELSAGQWVPLDTALKLPLTEATRVILTAFRDR